MRTAILAGALVLGFAAPSFAQAPGLPGGAGPHNDWRNNHQGWEGPLGHMRGGEMRAMMMFAHELASGTFYRFKRGDNEVDIHCPANASLPDCVNGAMHLMHALEQAGPSGASQSR